MKYSSVIEVDDNGEYFIRIPEELLQELGWNVDDTISWIIEGDAVILRKEVEEK
jgi:bifunctional DNA-binding transcriptional regulator/antitoxin component of YhaV-PrlF toxin-antitoxin module